MDDFRTSNTWEAVLRVQGFLHGIETAIRLIEEMEKADGKGKA